ncbi:MAG: EAL domain-containing protein [Sphingobium sp.]|nr:EAL domain-containing protein [Sphingobium sp.]
MRCPAFSSDEAGRLRALDEYGLEQGLPSLDPIVEIAQRMFGVPAAAVNMIGSDHVFFAASAGIGEADMRRDVSFCAHAINQNEVMVVPDARLDPRFHDNPIVAAGMIRFYAGVSLKSPDGHALGALCVIDSEPRPALSPADEACLRDLARIASDKLELRRLEIAAEIGRTQFESRASISPNAVIGFDSEGRVTAWNTTAATLFGHGASFILGKPLEDLVFAPDRPVVRAAVARILESQEMAGTTAEITAQRASGATFPAEIVWTRWEEGGRSSFGAVIRDISAHRSDREALYRLSHYDSLTGLANRTLLGERMSEALRADAALIIVDIDGFKDVNDTLGQAAGDEVLRIIAARLREIVPQARSIARIGGDEFAVLMVDETDPVALATVARSLSSVIAEPMVVEGHEMRIAASCGIAIAPDHGDTVEELTSSADLALFQAKSSGRGRSSLFIPALRAEAIARRMYEAELHRALERHEFCLFYQPQIRLADGALTGAEALIRWQHPVRGLLSPAAFLPALEGGVLASAVGLWTLREGCAQAARWRRLQPDFRVSINLFAAQFRNGDLPDQVRTMLLTHDLPPAAIELEITENIILDQQGTVLAQLEELRQMGVELSFDDFGTGFASLNLLRSYPVSRIKIDKIFTQSVHSSQRDRAIVLSIISMAHQCGISLVAEGVEEKAQADFLRDLGCDKGQGYYFGKPAPADLFAEQYWPPMPAVNRVH